MRLALTLLPALAQAAGGYNFASFQYPGAMGTALTGIDDSNRIVGYAGVPTPAGTQGFLITAAGSIATVTPPGTVYGTPSAINQRGGIVGMAYDTLSYSMFEDNINAFGGITDLLLNQDVTGVNGSFDIVGNFTSSSDETAVYAYTGGSYHTLLPSKCTYTHDPSINDRAVVAGNCVTGRNQSLVFTWNKGRYTYYTPPSNMVYVQATGINATGDIAGWFTDSAGYDHGFVLSGGVFTTVDYPGGTNTQIMGINKAGKLVGTYVSSGALGFIATPK